MSTSKFFGDANDISTFGNITPNDVNLVSTFGWIGGGLQDSVVISNHVTRALSLLIEEFKRSTRLNDVVRIIVEECQVIENMYNDLLTGRRLDQAGGAQLDGIGEIVGEDREGRNDTDYRAAIRFRIYINISNAEPETIITALKFVTQASRIRYWEIRHATIQLFTSGSFIPDEIITFMKSVVGGGIKIEYISSSLNTLPLSFALDGGGDNPEGGGLNEYNYTPGGEEIGGQIVEGYM